MVFKANLVKLVIDDLVLNAKLVLILTVLKVKFDCTSEVRQLTQLLGYWQGSVVFKMIIRS